MLTSVNGNLHVKTVWDEIINFLDTFMYGNNENAGMEFLLEREFHGQFWSMIYPPYKFKLNTIISFTNRLLISMASK